MKSVSFTVRLDGDLANLLTRASRRLGRSRSAIVRVALRRHLRIARFKSLAARIAPFAKSRGLLTDEDVFRRVS